MSTQTDHLPPAPAALLARRFTTPGRHPYDDVEWERRHARIEDVRDGSVVFEQRDIEFPTSWSLTASNVVAQKYFRGPLDSPEREWSLRQVIDRVVDTFATWGAADGYFVEGGDDDVETFRAELTWLLLHQRVAFNSPVWFNIGVPWAKPQGSACYILSVADDLPSILEWYAEEGLIFQGGSGAGVNLSQIRASTEALRGGGTASGPVSFMRGADASAGTIKSGGTTRRAAKMVILDDDHPDIEEFVWCKAREERKIRALRDAGFDVDLDGADSHSVQYQNANNSVRLSDEFMAAVEADQPWDLVARTTGEVVDTVSARDLFTDIAQAAWECADPGVQFDTTINRWHTIPQSGRITASNPCSEYLSIDDSSCNLASLNLLAFLDEDGRFDVDGFRHAVRVLITAMDILVGHAHYPTEAITRNTLDFRQLGLGFTNLGAVLMALGLPYDSDDGRSLTSAITALMTGEAYRTSTVLAERLGPFAGYAPNAVDTQRVLGQHRDALADVSLADVQPDLAEAAWTVWDDVVERAAVHGVRNAQASVIAPTGTISFMLDCDTTGIEPDLGLVKLKKLVGGGTLTIVNQTVPRALRRLGYDDDAVADITDHISRHASVVDAPHLRAEHRDVFACSMGDLAIEPEGHVRMLAAVQPFISGASSKTVNLPATATPDDIEELLRLSWRLGVKCVAVYRDGCKVGQPLSVGSAADLTEDTGADATVAGVELPTAPSPVRERLPRRRRSRTYSFRVADCHGFMTVGEYTDGRPGEVFLKVAKQGSTLAGIMDALAISVSHGLQYGVPLRAYVEAFSHVRFEPAGITDDPDLRLASSLVDYIFRRLALDYLPADERQELGILSTEERVEPTLPGFEGAGVASTTGADVVPDPAPDPVAVTPVGGDGWATVGDVADAPAAGGVVADHAPLCSVCGAQMVRAGACHACPSCGATSGCS